MVGRLTRDARRGQLLEVAWSIIGREGTDALTLARLAERAGVSKPVAYDHFGTRAGLLSALFRSFDVRQVEAMRAAMAEGGDTLEAAARIAAAGYLDCLAGNGPEWDQLCAALLAYDETKDHLDESREVFAEAYREVFAPFVALDGARGRATLTALIGAAEALARDQHAGRIGLRTAVDALAELIHATLAPLAKRPASAAARSR